MNGIHQSEPYYDNTRSPRSNSDQSQTLNRQPSRNFQTFGQQGDSSYGFEPRYDGPRYDRMNTMPNGYSAFDMSVPQAWNNAGYAHNNNLAGINATTRGRPQNAQRPGLPSMWLDQAPAMGPPNGLGAFGGPSMGAPPYRQDQMGSESEEDLIPTAIVIKNIPFAVKKEQLVQVMTELNLPLPYAFNYHFDNGVFRGLAFANFTTADETGTVIQAMNHLELHGRKLRVEYKKMLPQAERDRIEREKRERRGQLEEQHRPMAASQLQTRPSVSSMTSAMRGTSPNNNAGMPSGVDMNDPITLDFFTQMLLFKSDPTRDSYAFAANIPPLQRTIIHGLAHHLGLGHESVGVAEQRHVCVYKNAGNGAALSPTSQQAPFDPNRRGLYRAATTDFSDVRDREHRESNPTQYGPVGRQASMYLGFPEAQNALAPSNNLRSAKSFGDLRSFTPSPSNANFPANLAANAARYAAELGQSSPGTNLPPTNAPATNSTTSATSDTLVNGMNNMNLNSGFNGRQTSPSRLRAMMSWEREAPGPIGGHRGYVNGTTEEPSQSRQKNGTLPRPSRNGVASGFSRGRPNGHQNHGSDEMLAHNGIDTVPE